MAYRLPEKVRGLTPYPPVTEKLRIRCDANESCFTLPAPLLEEVRRRVAEVELGRYPDPYATECCALAASRHGLLPEQAAAGNGSDELIGLLIGCLMDRGDTLVTLEHDFSMYAFYAQMAGINRVELKKNADLSVDADAVAGALSRSGAQALIFSNPCNPTSLLLPCAQVERIVASTRALVVVDEAYMEFADDSAIGLVRRYDNLVVLKTCSKAVGLAGVRVGFALGDARLIGFLRSAKSPYNVNSLSQAVAAAVLASPGYVEACARRLADGASQLCRAVEELAGQFPGLISPPAPTRTNFIYFRVRSEQDAQGIRQEMRRRGVAIRCIGGYLRISTGTPEENRDVLQNLRDVLSHMKGAVE